MTLNILSDDDCWEVMWQRELRSDKNLGGLEEIGRKIANKCGGLPLLACSIGYLMSRRTTTEAWEDIRERVILDPKADCVKGILNCLKSSYHFMPFDVKLCFTYCAVFLKGFAINSDILIQQWIALGYIQSVHDGERCISFLLGMSFLQISPNSQVAPMHSRAPKKLIMHDMVHELAKEIADSETVIIRDDLGKIRWGESENHSCRHMHLVNCDKEQSKVLRKVPGKIRSLHFTGCSIMLLLEDSSFKAKYLRVLDISGCDREGHHTPGSTEMSLPSSNFMLLRYLDASGLPISTLPKSLLGLQSMQTLILSNCLLETLPDDIGSLLKLCYLDLSGNRSLKKLPKSLGNLSQLSFLNLSGCSKLQEVPDESIHELQCLRHLDMSGCCELRKLPDSICILPKLLVLNLSSCYSLTKLPDKLELKTLEHMNLSSCHKLQNLPQDFGKLRNLEFLNLSDCHKVQVLPDSFCDLTNLKELNLSDCHDIRELPEYINNLSRLQSLNLTSCYKLQSLPSTFCKMPELKHLNLSYCARLKKLPMSFGELRLQTLDISCCVTLHDLPESINKMTSLTQLHITSGHPSMFTKAQTIKKGLNITNREVHDDSVIDDGKCQELEIAGLLNVHLENIDRTNLHDNPELRVLRLRWDCSILEKHTDAGNLDCSILEKTDQGKQVLEKLIPSRSLEDFALFGYPSKDFPTWIHNISSYLPNVHSIHLYKAECHSLPPIGRLPNLRYLVINSAPNITKISMEFYGEKGTCKKLRFISLESLDNLAEWWTTRSGHDLIPNLLRLEVKDCAKLKFLPYPPKTMYWYLHSSEEVLPKHGCGLLSSSSSTLPFSVHIVECRFSPDKWARLRHLATLEVLGIVGCRDLGTLPEVIKCFGNLKSLYLRSCEKLEMLPEWLGQLISLEELRIKSCPGLICLPESICNLTTLKKLYISDCPKLTEKCKGEDAHKISHVPEKFIEGTRLDTKQPIRGSEGSRRSDVQKLLCFSLVGAVSLCLYILARSELTSN